LFLQLENILLDDNFNAKLSDFGFASYVDTDNQLTGDFLFYEHLQIIVKIDLTYQQ